MRSTSRHRITRFEAGHARETIDAVAAEEPLEIRVDGQPVAVTMRTPGNDFELASGFCLTEGIVEDSADIATIRYCDGRDEQGHHTFNVVDLARSNPRPVAEGQTRRTYTSSSCGICGTASIDSIRKDIPALGPGPRIEAEVLLALPDRLRAQQRVFDTTGGLHAAGVFTSTGDVVVIREDVGRHNAVDKVIGWAAGHGHLPLSDHVLAVSGRVAFEIVQKALRAGLPIIAAVSAPTSLAVDLAHESQLTLAGFVRGQRMNVYSGADRIVR